MGNRTQCGGYQQARPLVNRSPGYKPLVIRGRFRSPRFEFFLSPTVRELQHGEGVVLDHNTLDYGELGSDGTEQMVGADRRRGR